MSDDTSESEDVPKRKKALKQSSVEPAEKRFKSNNSSPESCLRRAGTINRMILKNFMCHSLLEVDFTQNNISMLIGKNGSGKSALLTALIIGLGGKANVTNRGSSIKSFVKTGKTSATIEIQLCNDGPMSYRPQVYGNTITIIRNLSASGGGSYRVKAENGAIIATQAKEVLNITSYLNIQVDNPVCVLTQDTARNFLSSSDPKKKFTLFIKATGLDVLENEFKNITKNRNDAEQTLEYKKQHYIKLQEEVRKLKIKIDSHNSIENLKERKVEIQNELLWAEVKEVEDQLAEEGKIVDKIVKKLEAHESNHMKKGQEVLNLEKQISESEQQLADLKNQLEVSKQPQEIVKTELQNLQKTYNETKQKRHGLSIEIDTKQKDLAYLEQEIKNANENMSKVVQERKQRLDKLNVLKNKLKEANELTETNQNELFQIKNNISKNEDEANNVRAECNQVEQQLRQKTSNLRALNSEQGNPLLLYGQNMPKIKQMIEKQKDRFRQEPRGPLGSYIKLTDKKWAVAVEGHITGGLLRAFTVDNQNDCNLLRQIFKQCLGGEAEPTIITSKFINQKHRVQDNLVQAPNDCQSLYDVMVIDDPIVSNCIVDQLSPENVLLIPSEQRAMELMAERQRVPKNCKQGITIEGDKYFPDPNYRTYASTYNQARYLQVDTKEHLKHLKEEIATLNQKKQTLLNQLNALQKEIQNQTTAKTEMERKIQKMSVLKQQCRQQYSELSNDVEPEIHDLNTLEQELQDIKSLLVEKGVTLKQYEDELKSLKSQIMAQHGKLSNMKEITQGLEERVWPLQEEIQNLQTKKRQLTTSSDFDQRVLEELQSKVNKAQEALTEKQEAVTTKLTNATKYGKARPTELRTCQEIKSEIQQLARNISTIETESENIDRVTQKYRKLRDKDKSARNILEALDQNVKELIKGVQQRKTHYELTENYFQVYIKHSFQKMMEFRQFRGKLDINMEQKKLDLVVMPQQGSQGLVTTSNLSGGERSFSTVSFLYSLWQCTNFPFYFLDEFDVYMDRLNRTKVIEILLHHAKSKSELQFVFLTPQDVSFITQEVSILKLEDPRRLD